VISVSPRDEQVIEIVHQSNPDDDMVSHPVDKEEEHLAIPDPPLELPAHEHQI
jgi:hypothetical protein